MRTELKKKPPLFESPQKAQALHRVARVLLMRVQAAGCEACNGAYFTFWEGFVSWKCRLG